MPRFPIATRESFIPKGSVKVADRKSDAVAYVYTTPRGTPAYAVFYGRQVRPVAHFTARSEAERTKRVADLFASRQARAAAAASFKASQAVEAALIAGDHDLTRILARYSMATRLEFETVAGVRVYRRSFVSSYA